MVNPTNELPVIDNGDRDVVFMVWDLDQQYLAMIKAYYPDGIEEPFNYAPAGNGAAPVHGVPREEGTIGRAAGAAGDLHARHRPGHRAAGAEPGHSRRARPPAWPTRCRPSGPAT